MHNHRVLRNSIYQYLVTLAQHIFPVFTFPYLTRVLGPEGYAVVSFMTGFVVYFQYLIDYGFILFSTRRVAEAQENYREIQHIWGATTQAKLLLSVLSICLFSLIAYFTPILRSNLLIGYLYLLVPVLSTALPDYIFRGLEDMKIMTTRYVVSKTFSTVMVFVLVKSIEDIIYIPILNIASSIVAVALTRRELVAKYKLKITWVGFKEVFTYIRLASVFFLSTAVTTAFGAFNTTMMGIMNLGAIDLGYWGAFYGLISSAQGLYSPIVNSIYPHVARTKQLDIVKKTLKLLFPIVVVAAILTWIFAPNIILLLAGSKFAAGVAVFRALIPVLVFSFPVLLLNFPVLGAMGFEKQSAKLTIAGATYHILGMVSLAIINRFSIRNIAMLRSSTELVMLLLVVYYVRQNTKLFTRNA